MLEKTLESPLDYKEIQPINPKGNQSWIFTGRTDSGAEAPIFWPLDMKNWLTGKDPEVRKDWRQEEKGTTEDKMVGWHHRLGGHEFEQVLGVGVRQGSLACCSPWDCKEWIWLSNWNELIQSTSCEMLGWMKHEPESRLSGKISTTSNGRKWRSKESLEDSERGQWKNWLEIQHSKKLRS